MPKRLVKVIPSSHIPTRPLKIDDFRPKKHQQGTRKVVGKKLPKLYVLDTNVLMHDPSSLFSFQENDIAILSTVLEELDNHKKGRDDPNRNARETSRLLSGIFSQCEKTKVTIGVSLQKASNSSASGNIFMYRCVDNGKTKADNIIIEAVKSLSEKNNKDKKYSEVVLVSKDINMRLKAWALGIDAEDYLTDKTLEDTDVLPPGTIEVTPSFLNLQNLESWKDGVYVYYRAPKAFKLAKLDIKANEFITDGNNHYQVVSINEEGITLRTLIDYSKEKNSIFGVRARNYEQNYSLNLLMDEKIHFVVLSGPAGTGKTLLTIATALQRTVEENKFSEVIYTRITIPVGEDIGFLPGTEEEKMAPWSGALQDNLDVLVPPNKDSHKKDGVPQSQEWARSATMELIRSRVKVKSMNFMRGRTFLNKFLIIDEAQNLTPKQMKTLITRAGPGTKVVCLGNVSQIDTPYLSEGSSGLTYVVERFRGWKHFGHITLKRGERSLLAEHANEVL